MEENQDNNQVISGKTKPKWYFSYPVLMASLLFCFPLSLILSVIRLQKYKGWKKGYSIRSILAVAINIVMILMIGQMVTSSIKWEKNYAKNIKDGNYNIAESMLDEHYKDSITLRGVEQYLKLFELSGNYDDFERVILAYHNSLEDKTEFNEKIMQKIKDIDDKLSSEQKKVLKGIFEDIEEAKRKKEKESKAIAESKSNHTEENESMAKNESDRIEESETMAKNVSEKSMEEFAESEAIDKKENIKIRKIIEQYMENSQKKDLNELRKKDKLLVWKILRDEYIREALNERISYPFQAKSKIKKYCELYQEAFSESTDDIDNILENIHNIENLENGIKNTKEKYSYELREGIESLETYEWYVKSRLETHYDDTISGTIRKEVDSYNRKNDSEWIAYNVEYLQGIAMPCGDVVILHSRQLNPFSKAGAYTLQCILSSEKKTLVDSNGFQFETPIYEIVSDTQMLTNDYNYILKSENQIEQIWYQIMQSSDELAEQAIGNNNDSTKINNMEDIISPDMFYYHDEDDTMIEPYIMIENSSSTYLTDSDVYWMTPEQLRYAINEIYARHGRLFKDTKLQEWFNKQEWYQGSISSESFDENMLSEIEKANIQVLQHWRDINSH